MDGDDIVFLAIILAGFLFAVIATLSEHDLAEKALELEILKQEQLLKQNLPYEEEK